MFTLCRHPNGLLLFKWSISHCMIGKEESIQSIFQRNQCLLPYGRFQLALPNSDAMPPHIGKCQLGRMVSLLVPADFLLPKFNIRLWHLEKLAIVMSMPETTIDEDACTIFSHHQIGMTRQALVRQTISEATREEVFSHYHLRTSVPRPYGRHDGMSLLLVQRIHLPPVRKALLYVRYPVLL